MKLSLTEPKFFKDSISIISELVTEARFTIGPQGITLVAMDPANVAMVIFKLLPSLFAEYQLKEQVDVSLNLNNLKQILRRVGSNEVLTIELENNAKLILTISGKSTRRFSLPIISTEEKEQKTPTLAFHTTIVMNVDRFNEAVEDASIVADSLVLQSDGNKFIVSAVGDMNNADIEMPAEENLKIESEDEDVAKSRYSVEYLKKMVGGSKLSDTVKIQFKKNYPLKLEYVCTDKVQLSFVLAPRVEHE
ncbi:MAG: proliferating cell nuclear antigen (pcna) [Candidatus Woesearchaeota archaeon]